MLNVWLTISPLPLFVCESRGPWGGDMVALVDGCHSGIYLCHACVYHVLVVWVHVRKQGKTFDIQACNGGEDDVAIWKSLMKVRVSLV